MHTLYWFANLSSKQLMSRRMRTSKYEYANKKPLSTWLNSTSSVPSTLSREERKRTEEDPSKGGQPTTQLETQRSNKWASGCAGHSRERHAWNACWRSRKRGHPSRRSGVMHGRSQSHLLVRPLELGWVGDYHISPGNYHIIWWAGFEVSNFRCRWAEQVAVSNFWCPWLIFVFADQEILRYLVERLQYHHYNMFHW